jgi:hypothetical protein
LHENLVINFVGEVADEDVEVARRVLLVGGVGLVRPVDPDFLLNVSNKMVKLRSSISYRLVHTAPIERLHSTFRGTRIVVLDEAIVVALGL